MSKITNDGLTRCGSRCFIAVRHQWASKGFKSTAQRIDTHTSTVKRGNTMNTVLITVRSATDTSLSERERERDELQTIVHALLSMEENTGDGSMDVPNSQ